MSEETGEPGSPENGAEPIPIRLVASDQLDDILAELSDSQATWVRANGFRARLGTALALPGKAGSVARVLVGWGTEALRHRERLHLGSFARTAPAGNYRLEDNLTTDEAEQAALGWMLGRYRFDRYKPDNNNIDAELVTPEGVDGARIGRIAEGVFIARDLINTPANDMGPEALEQADAGTKCSMHRRLAARLHCCSRPIDAIN
jgi:leucyl aminopeptidase